MYTIVSKHFIQSKDANKSATKGLISVFTSLCLWLVCSATLAADQEAPEERWFEIEVILYKEISDKGLTNESWDTESPFNLPENLKDFLNPIAPTELSDDLNQTNSDKAPQQSSIKSPNNHQVDLNDTASTDSSVDQSLDEDAKELAFIPLEQSLLQLQKEAKNISVHPNFRLLSHFAWRQPVAGKSSAIPVRFAGGHDYHETFEFNGTKKLEINNEEPLSDPRLTIDEIDGSQQLNDGLNQNGAEISQEQNNRLTPLVGQTTDHQINSTTDKSDENLDIEPPNSQPTLLPWVPEIDGSAIVYIYRNYLHLDADLVFRKPGQLEVDIYSLDSPLKLDSDPFIAPTTPLTDELKSFQNSAPIDSQSQTLTEEDGGNQFTWHFDSNFLNQDSEKVYTEKLFNYPLKQTRRMRSTELHYFDHPKIGMLVVIRPYQLETNAEENINH